MSVISRFPLVLLLLLPFVAGNAMAQSWAHNPFGIYRHLHGRSVTLPDGRIKRWRWTRLGRITEETLDSKGHVSELAVIDLGKEGHLNRAEWNGGVPYFLRGIPMADGSIAWFSPRTRAPFRTTYDGRRFVLQEFPLSGDKAREWALITTLKPIGFSEQQGDDLAQRLYPLTAAGADELMNPTVDQPPSMEHAAAFARALMASQRTPQGAAEFWACEYIDPATNIYYSSNIGMKPKGNAAENANSDRRFELAWHAALRAHRVPADPALAKCEVMADYGLWDKRLYAGRARNPRILGVDPRSLSWGPNLVD